ncbi:hypothetical protein T06_15407 [Trichinella sp. T6]|nr:hypothetical protein T06_15407 [Trichinella sp. T6]
MKSTAFSKATKRLAIFEIRVFNSAERAKGHFCRSFYVIFSAAKILLLASSPLVIGRAYHDLPADSNVISNRTDQITAELPDNLSSNASRGALPASLVLPLPAQSLQIAIAFRMRCHGLGVTIILSRSRNTQESVPSRYRHSHS